MLSNEDIDENNLDWDNKLKKTKKPEQSEIYEYFFRKTTPLTRLIKKALELSRPKE
jgi:hypothetical protein